VTDADLDAGRIRVADTKLELLPAVGTTVQAYLRGVGLTWTVQGTDDPQVRALAPVAASREEFFAVIDEGHVLRVSREQSGVLWLD
jgi:hypothetical protein